MTNPRSFRWLVGCFVVCLSLVLTSCTGEYARLKQEQFPYVFSIAERLGYTSDLLIAQGDQCTGGVLTSSLCNLFVIYKTPLTLSEFGALLPKLALKQTGYEVGDGRYLFTVINYDTQHKLIVAGNEGVAVEKLPQLLDFSMYDWSYQNVQQKNLIVRFFDSAKQDPPLLIDGQPVQSNIVMITYQLGIVRL